MRLNPRALRCSFIGFPVVLALLIAGSWLLTACHSANNGRRPWVQRSYKSAEHSPKQDGAPLLARERNAAATWGYRDLGHHPHDTYDTYDAYAQNTESYDPAKHNHFLTSHTNPLSTFSIDVDTASYTNVRRMLSQGQLPPAGAVRIEEMVNYFDYNYPAPAVDISEMHQKPPFNVHMEVNQAPWQPEHRLVRIGLKGMTVSRNKRPASNLVFLLDVSGSMGSKNKLPLVKKSMLELLDQLNDRDRVAIVVYAGASGLVLPSTSASDESRIRRALKQLESGGSTNGGDGIQLAYAIAERNYIPGGVNRVILATDGDFNVGVTNREQLIDLVKANSQKGVDLTILGFGQGNYKDAEMEALSNCGNSNYAYIDSMDEAEKTLVKQISGTLVTIAKDVKIQVEFNPARVHAYRLVGYENRRLKKEDFNNDRVDAGDIGAGHTVTALYEIIPTGLKGNHKPIVDELKYQRVPEAYDVPVGTEVRESTPYQNPYHQELLTVKLRYKMPKGATSKKLSFPLLDDNKRLAQSSQDFQFAAAVAGFGMILKKSPYAKHMNYDLIEELAEASTGRDRHEYREEFLDLVEKAKEISRRQARW